MQNATEAKSWRDWWSVTAAGVSIKKKNKKKKQNFKSDNDENVKLLAEVSVMILSFLRKIPPTMRNIHHKHKDVSTGKDFELVNTGVNSLEEQLK